MSFCWCRLQLLELKEKGKRSGQKKKDEEQHSWIKVLCNSEIRGI